MGLMASRSPGRIGKYCSTTMRSYWISSLLRSLGRFGGKYFSLKVHEFMIIKAGDPKSSYPNL
jgi:hypothetical protein